MDTPSFPHDNSAPGGLLMLYIHEDPAIIGNWPMIQLLHISITITFAKSKFEGEELLGVGESYNCFLLPMLCTMAWKATANKGIRCSPNEPPLEHQRRLMNSATSYRTIFPYFLPMWASISTIFSMLLGSMSGEVILFSTARHTPSDVWIPMAVEPS